MSTAAPANPPRNFRYKYTVHKRGQHTPVPLSRCPHRKCKADLTEDESVKVVLSVASKLAYFFTRLRPDGTLIDSEDQAIAKGFHSETLCARCDNQLTIGSVGEEVDSEATPLLLTASDEELKEELKRRKEARWEEQNDKRKAWLDFLSNNTTALLGLVDHNHKIGKSVQQCPACYLEALSQPQAKEFYEKSQRPLPVLSIQHWLFDDPEQGSSDE